MGEPTVVTAAAKFDSRRHGSTQHLDTPYLGWVDRTTPVHSSCGLVSSLKCNYERHRAPHSFGVRAAREKLPAVPKPLAGMRSPVDGMAFISCNLTATQSKTYLGGVSDSSGGGLYKGRI